MRSLLARHPIRFVSASFVAAGLVVVACTEVKKPTAPSQGAYPTITITANGISKEGPYLVPGVPVMVVNADTQVHRLHLDLGDQPGCGSLDSGDLAPGESRLTAPMGENATACAAHDHMHHGDPRFQVKLSVESGE
jgi:hypothetical protein